MGEFVKNLASGLFGAKAPDTSAIDRQQRAQAAAAQKDKADAEQMASLALSASSRRKTLSFREDRKSELGG